MRMIDSVAGRRGRRERKGLTERCTTSIYPVLNTYRIVAGIDRLAFQPPFSPSTPCLTETTRACRRLWNFAAADRTHDDDRAIYRPLLISNDTFSVLPFRIAGRPSRFSDFFRFSLFASFHFSLQGTRVVRRQMYGVSWIYAGLMSFLRDIDASLDPRAGSNNAQQYQINTD